MTKPSGSLCGRNTKSCRACKYRYPKGSKATACPKCNEARACSQPTPDGKACRYHGGKSPKGIDSPHYKHGRYSKYAPAGVLNDYRAYLRDSERIEVDDELAAMRTVFALTYSEVSSKATTDSWERAYGIYKEILRDYKPKGKRDGFLTKIKKMGAILEEGAGQERHIATLNKTSEQVRKLVDTKRQIAVDKGEFIARGYIIELLDRIAQGMLDYVKPLPGGQAAIKVISSIIRDFSNR